MKPTMIERERLLLAQIEARRAEDSHRAQEHARRMDNLIRRWAERLAVLIAVAAIAVALHSIWQWVKFLNQ